MNTFEFRDQQNEAISKFIQVETVSGDILKRFLREWGAHPDYEVDYIDRVIESLVDLNLEFYLTLTPEARADHLKALVKTVEIAFRMKRWEWDLLRKEYWQGYPLFFAGLSGMIDDLETIQRHAANLTPIFTPRVILVEGQSEAEFIEVLQVATGLIDLRFQVFVMNGSGALGNLGPYAAEKRRTGTKLYISFDADGNQTGAKQKAAKFEKTYSPSGIFFFERDFESSFPPDLIAEALNRYDMRLSRPQSWTTSQVEELLRVSQSLVKTLESETGTSFNKRLLGGLLGEALVNRDRQAIDIYYGKGWVEPFEIGRFLSFLTDRNPSEQSEKVL